MRSLVAVLAVLVFYGRFYRVVVARCGGLVQPVLRRLGLERSHPVREVEAVGKLAAAGVAQIGFAVVLAVLTGVSAAAFTGPGLDAELLAAAVALGAGELALTSLACTAIVQLSVLLSAATAREWSVASRAGWMSYFLLTARAAPAPLAAAAIGLYVGGEELIFRGILIPAFAGAGAAVAVTGAGALFVAMQAFGMPGRRAALYPMAGATVIAVVHGIVFWYVRDVVPLIVAHVSFFVTALAAERARTPAPDRALVRR